MTAGASLIQCAARNWQEREKEGVRERELVVAEKDRMKRLTLFCKSRLGGIASKSF